jgi:hypothetical protein
MVVFHSKTLAMPFMELEELPKFPADYVKVADVEAMSLEQAYEMTQNIENSWVKNPQVKPAPEVQEGCRSTSYGDVIEHLGQFWFCDVFGWVEITLEPSEFPINIGDTIIHCYSPDKTNNEPDLKSELKTVGVVLNIIPATPGNRYQVSFKELGTNHAIELFLDDCLKIK